MLEVKIFTLYPDLFPGPLDIGIFKKAKEKKIWNLKVINIRDYSKDNHGTVDDTPFGGGSGMLLRPDILASALDSNIKKETPNDVDNLLINYPSINVIGFNGKKSESMYKKFFKLNRSIKYVSLPSSSPANMAISFEDICLRWIELFK